MSQNKIVFSSIKAKKNPDNVQLKKDSDGYYEISLGALNIFNSAGAYYTLDKAKELFESSSSLMRRIENGALKAELGHPKRLPGMTMREYMNRILTIDIENIGAHIKSVELRETNVKDKGSKENMVLIVGKIKPNGPKAQYLIDLLEDPDSNVAFSIRSLTNDKIINGIVVKTLRTIVTWDIVVEPGLHVATKWKSLGIEELSLESLDLIEVDLNDKYSMKSIKHDLEEDIALGTEDSKLLKSEMLANFDCKMNGGCIVQNW